MMKWSFDDLMEAIDYKKKEELQTKIDEFQYDWIRVDQGDVIFIEFRKDTDRKEIHKFTSELTKQHRAYHPLVLIARGDFKIRKMSKRELIKIRKEIDLYLKED